METSNIAPQTDFQNISFDVPFEWKASWNNLSDNVSNMWSDISNWWNGLFNYTSNLASAETEVNNSYSSIDYYLLQSIQDPYARPNQKKART
ncbi:MAG: hypothetical protein MJ238_04355 [Bacilli bacterium]|nr:hypothetical protein [Bacilli bacterium]